MDFVGTLRPDVGLHRDTGYWLIDTINRNWPFTPDDTIHGVLAVALAFWIVLWFFPDPAKPTR